MAISVPKLGYREGPPSLANSVEIVLSITVHSLDGNYGLNYVIISCLTGVSMILGFILVFHHRDVLNKVETSSGTD